MIGPDEGTWTHIGLGLQEKTSPSINAKLCKEGISQKIAACTIPERTNTIWSQETIRNTKIISIASGCQNQEVHPTSMRQVSIPGPSSRQHTTLSNKRYSITISSTYHRYIGEHDVTTRLPRIAGGGSTIIPCERHDRLCAQRRKLLKRARSTQSSGRTLLPVQ